MAAGIRGVRGRTLRDSHREEEYLVGATVLCLVKNLHEVEKLLKVNRGSNGRVM